jgi:hypothetical protein
MNKPEGIKKKLVNTWEFDKTPDTIPVSQGNLGSLVNQSLCRCRGSMRSNISTGHFSKAFLCEHRWGLKQHQLRGFNGFDGILPSTRDFMGFHSDIINKNVAAQLLTVKKASNAMAKIILINLVGFIVMFLRSLVGHY